MKTETLGPPRKGGSRTRPPRPQAEPAEPEARTEKKPRRKARAGKDGE